ncbi:hypothetical protein BD309DRAFT_944293 [Dichomitus squalens]|nr:hypothetical protein BD309DRAFT_944293 [Dichomitus squalens]
MHTLRPGLKDLHGTYEPLTWSNIPYAHAWLIAYLFMAYLTRRPHTHIVRLLFLPIFVYFMFWCTLRYRIEDPRFGWYNWLRGLLALAATAQAITFASRPEGLLRIGEIRHAPLPNETYKQPYGSENGIVPQTPESRVIVLACISDAFEVGVLARGIGWQYAYGLHVPKARRPSERSSYLKSTLISVMRAYLFVDLIDSFLDTLPGITATTGSLYLPALSPVLRYIVATALHVLAGFVIILGIEMWYDIASLVGVGVFQQSPSSWPPFHDEPWFSSSLHEFWSKRWHQALRQTFLVYGGYPGWWVAGDLGMLFGTFLASGLFHEIGLYVAGEPIDPWVTLFFFAQPFGILAEKFYKKQTGRRVNGTLGVVMVVVFVVVLGQVCTDSWLRRGMGGKVITPPALSPARRIIIPYLRGLCESH